MNQKILPWAMYDNWKAHFCHTGIACMKLTHEAHAQLQQCMADAGCTSYVMECHIGYLAGQGGNRMNENQKDSHLHCPPVQAVIATTDGDPHNPKNHQPHWNVTIFPNEYSPSCPRLMP
jgi:hypothetical protein